MPFKHGVFGSVLPTLYRLTQVADVDVPVVIGTAPVHRLKGGAANVNVPFLCLDPGSTMAAFGCATPTGAPLGSDWAKWTLNSAFYMCFNILNASNKPSPVFVNVFNPLVHMTPVISTLLSVVGKVITIPIATADVILDSVVVQDTAGITTLVNGLNYITGYDTLGNFLITILDAVPTATYKVAYNKVSLVAITASLIVGGTDASNKNTGLSVINDVWSKLNVVPGILIAPQYMGNTLVTTAADALVQSVNAQFKARTIVNLDDPVNAKSPATALASKGTLAATDSRMDVIWPPRCQFGPITIESSVVNAFIQGVITQDPLMGNGVPYWSVSNHLVPGMTGTALADGTPVIVRPNDATFLNNNGIMTYVSYQEGYFTWGNRTGAYPISTDVTQVFSIVQRELDWLSNSIVLTLRPWVDNPTNQRLIESIILTVQTWLSSLVSGGALFKGLIEFLQVDNPISNLANGKIVFHYLVTPPIPAEDIENNFEFDVTGLNTLFSLVNASASSGAVSGGGLTVQ